MSNVTIGPPGTGSLPTANSIDAVNDYIPIYTNSALATQAINRNTFLGLGSQPVSINDTQTLTNKTITSPTISGPTLSGTIIGTYTIGGTPTFPSSVVTLTGSQTLTSKTLTSPTINSPTITNATLTTDTITGFTTSNTGSIYGMSVSGGLLASAAMAGQVVTASLATGIQPTTVEKNPYKFSVYRNSAANTGNNAFALLTFDTKTFDTGTNYSTSTGLFTAPITGFYQFNWAVQTNQGSGSHTIQANLYANTGSGTTSISSGSNSYSANAGNISTGSYLISLAATNTVSIEVYGDTTLGIATGSVTANFQGFLVSAT